MLKCSRTAATALIATGFTVLAPATAEPLRTSWVPAEARWVVHVDVEAAATSTIGRFLVEHRDALSQGEYAQFREKTGVDPATDVKGLTVYGTKCDPADAVAIIVTSSAVDPFLDKLRAEETSYRQIKSGGRVLDAWTEDGCQRYGFTVKQGDRRLLLVSQALPRLERAISVVEGADTGGLSAALATLPKEGSILFIAAVDVAEAVKQARTVMFQKMQDLRLDIGEAAGELFGELQVNTPSLQEAKDLKEALEGGIAVARMMAPSRAELQPILDAAASIRFSASETLVVAKFSYDGQKALDMLRSALDVRIRGGSTDKKVEKRGDGDGTDR
jgi:hypothetical protein